MRDRAHLDRRRLDVAFARDRALERRKQAELGKRHRGDIARLARRDAGLAALLELLADRVLDLGVEAVAPGVVLEILLALLGDGLELGLGLLADLREPGNLCLERRPVHRAP